jgi:ParB-like chromosome segregation protein Spo0J
MIAEGLQDLAVPVDRLAPLQGNPRKGDVAAVAKSLKRFGQRKPVVATLDGTIIAGNHTHAAALSLGWDEIAVVYVDDDDTEAKAFALADNRTSDLGTYDNEALVDMMQAVAAADLELLEQASYTAEDLSDLMDFMNVPLGVGNDGDIGSEGDNSKGGKAASGLVCPNCGHHL